MASPLRVSDVFVPGKLPEWTYNPRSDYQLEQSVADYIEEAGSILTLSGPTKTGKTVLLRRVVRDYVWVDGQGIDSTDEFWRRVADELGVYTNVELGSTGATTDTVQGTIGAGVPAVLKSDVSVSASDKAGDSRRFSVQRPIGTSARQALERSQRALVLDDFHFIGRSVQRQLVRSLKPVVLAGVPIVFVSISHRLQDVVTAEPDMTGRVSSISVDFWSESELMVIAAKGFEALNLIDRDSLIALNLAQNSFGSPHLM